MTREQLINRLLRKYRASGVTALLDTLQNEGIVSDEAVTIEDVAIRDLVRAYQRFDS